MKIISLLTHVERTERGLKAAMVTTSAGTVILLGPGDFASHSPFASFYNHDSTDKDMFSLRALPFEKMGLNSLQIRIAPTVDLGKRGGLYAAVLERLDVEDTRNFVDTRAISALVSRFPTDYQDIIKHPRAKLAPVTRTISLSLNGSRAQYDIRAAKSETLGWVNSVYTHVLCIAFSDMAAVQDAIGDNYSPTHGLFELHMTGKITLSEPSELSLTTTNAAPTMSASVVTAKVLTNGTKKLTKFFHYAHEEIPGHEGMIYSYPPLMRQAICKHYGVEEPGPEDMNFEMLNAV